MLIDNHSVPINRGKVTGQLPLEHIFVFCKTFKKITKIFGFHLTFKTAGLQDFFFTLLANDINVTVKSVCLFVPILIPNTDTQVMFNEPNKNNYTISYGSWYTERKIVTDGNEFQVDVASAQYTDSPLCLIPIHQTEARIGTPNRANNITFFDHVDKKKYLCEIYAYR